MIIATAGHVDHGKTSLVRALTGVDTDRLPEEKKRKLTIDLGFAYLPISDRRTIGFIDVPGHERFIRNALCGLTGTDFVLFIIAADDGPMPQTREHLAMIDLMGISRGAIAITKTDRVEADWLDVVREEIVDLFAKTTLGNASIFAVSSETGEGVAALRTHLEEEARRTRLRADTGRFRLAIDRAFDVVGTGLVVTGTVFSGHVEVGDTVQLAGRDRRLRVRGIHAQNAKADIGRAGQRCALNLSGTELRKSEVVRGGWIVAEGVAGPVQKFDARIRVLPDLARSLAHWTPVHVHLGAAETTGRVAVLEGEAIKPNTTGLVQISVDQPIGAVFGDRVIVRDQSAQFTIGGGHVVDIYPPRRGRAKPARVAWLRASEASDPASGLLRLIEIADSGVLIDRFAENRNLTQAELAEIERQADFNALSSPAGRLVFSKAVWEDYRLQVLAWVRGNPDGQRDSGQSPPLDGAKVTLMGRNGTPLPSQLTSLVVDAFVADGSLVRDADGLRAAGQQSRLSGADAALWEQVAGVFDTGGLRPMTPREIAGELSIEVRSIERLLARAGRQGLVVQISKSRFLTMASLRALAEIAQKLVSGAPDGQLSVAGFRDASGVGRNMAIEILEYFDKRKFTRRLSDGREVCQAADKVFPAS